jgi:mannan endo-1,4-beta-mannosidase
VVVGRVNSVNGLRYRDDPTIFAWNIMNEPRCKVLASMAPVPWPWLHALTAGSEIVDTFFAAMHPALQPLI